MTQEAKNNSKWSDTLIKTVLLDINGVLFESGEDNAIEGSVAALNRLVDAGIKFCLVTNECTSAKRLLAEKLQRFGYNCIDADKIVSPAPLACHYIEERKLKPRFHVWDGVLEDFSATLERRRGSGEPPDCLVIGDVMDKLSRDLMDESLELMLKSPSQPVTLVALGSGRYYKDSGRLRMDTGAYVAAFEHCLGVKAVHFGKPAREFFVRALLSVGGLVEETCMIGDDVLSDVGAAQQIGLRAFLVRTGKYRPADEARGVTPDQVFANLAEAVDTILASNERLLSREP